MPRRMSSQTLPTGLVTAMLLLVLGATPALADWSLDPARSHLAFISIKSEHIGEVHTFTKMMGHIDQDGHAEVAMMLDSVETLIPIRDERMRELLFKTTDYAQATLTAKVDPAIVAAMAPGDIADVTAEAVLSLHGQQQSLILQMQAAKVADDKVMVASTKPLVIDAAKFGLSEGVEKLREIAGLASISHSVPVSFVLTFVDTPPSAQ